MKKIALFFFLIVATTLFGENFVLDNQTSYPQKNQKSKIAIEWANSAKQVQESNEAVISGLALNQQTIQALTKTGKIVLNVPDNAQYFRVLVWSKGQAEPDLITNWVDVVPNKTYTLESDDLVPTVLMVGVGC